VVRRNGDCCEGDNDRVFELSEVKLVMLAYS